MKHLGRHFGNLPYVKRVVGSCCGHGKYPPTIIVENRTGGFYEAISGKRLYSSRGFYKKDKKGIYHIPENAWGCC